MASERKAKTGRKFTGTVRFKLGLLVLFATSIIGTMLYTSYYYYMLLARSEHLHSQVDDAQSLLTKARLSERLFIDSSNSSHHSDFSKDIGQIDTELSEVLSELDNNEQKTILSKVRTSISGYSAEFGSVVAKLREFKDRLDETKGSLQAVTKLLESIRGKLDGIKFNKQIEGADFTSDEYSIFYSIKDLASEQQKLELLVLRIRETPLSDSKKQLEVLTNAAKAEFVTLAQFAKAAKYPDIEETAQKIRKNWETAFGAVGKATALAEDLRNLDKALEEKTQIASVESSKLVALFEQANRDISSTAITRLLTLIGVSAALFIFGSILISRSLTVKIGGVVKELMNGSKQVQSCAEEVSSASNKLAQGANEQAAAVEEVSASLEEIASMASTNAAQASQAAGKTKIGQKAVNVARDDMRDMGIAIREIREAGTKIAQIIESINEIAFQTNLLALNAAVEAARAGDAGRGFAVVADEVRSLAQRAANSASNTQTLIATVIERMEAGSELVGKAETGFESVVKILSEMGGFIEEIAQASTSEAHSIVEVKKALSNVDQVVQSNASAAEETAAAAEEMDSSASNMAKVVVELSTIV